MTEQQIMISPAGKADLPAIRLLLQELMDAMEDTEGFDLDTSVENCRALLDEPDSYILVARRGDGLLGLIAFTTRRTIMHPDPSGLIDEMVVSAASRGSGLGRMLIRAAMDKCRELGCCELEVSTETSNTNAQAFYKSVGFDDESVLLEMDLDED